MFLFEEGLKSIALSMKGDDPIEESTDADAMFIGIRGMEFIYALSWKHGMPVEDHLHRVWKLWRFTPTDTVPGKYHSLTYFSAMPYQGMGGILLYVAFNDKGWASVATKDLGANFDKLLDEIERLNLV